jgi:hypothetical protein
MSRISLRLLGAETHPTIIRRGSLIAGGSRGCGAQGRLDAHQVPAQVVRRRPDGSWLRLLDYPEIAPSADAGKAAETWISQEAWVKKVYQ